MPKRTRKPDYTISPEDSEQTVLEKLQNLADDIMALRVAIPEIRDAAERLRREALQDPPDLKVIHSYVTILVIKCDEWGEELAGRYTFLLNLKEWLEMVNGDEQP
jgi:hypothetical protein